MDSKTLDHVVRNLDQRLQDVEQLLPTLATREDVQAAIAHAVAPLATKEELRQAIAPLATKTEVRESEERTRRHFDVVAERLEGHIRLLAEGQGALHEGMRELGTEIKADIARLDRRVMRLEASRT